MSASDERGELQHTFKNHLAVIAGFCDMLLLDLPPADPSRESVQEIRKSARAALDLVPRLLEGDACSGVRPLPGQHDGTPTAP